ncbi:MAG: hypothetical protein AAF236_05830 [Verrucomicrobiota bacterium]
MSDYFNTPELPQQPQPAVRQKVHPVAKIAMILGIVSICSFFCFGYVSGGLAVMLGVIALVIIGEKRGEVIGKKQAITGITLGTIAAVLGGGVALWLSRIEESSDTVERVKTPRELAESRLGSSEFDGVGFGNNDQAAAIATTVGTQMREMRGELFTGDEDGFSLSGHVFRTHCELGEGTAAFIVKVPSLRKYEDEAKDMMADLAWMVSRQALADAGFGEGTEMAVGIKGVILYHQIQTGTLQFEDSEGDEMPGVAEESSLKSVLDRFFPEPEPQPETIDSELDAGGDTSAVTSEPESEVDSEPPSEVGSESQ